MLNTHSWTSTLSVYNQHWLATSWATVIRQRFCLKRVLKNEQLIKLTIPGYLLLYLSMLNPISWWRKLKLSCFSLLMRFALSFIFSYFKLKVMNLFEVIIEVSVNVLIFASVFSSPELKAQVSFSYHLSSVVCLCVRPSVCLSVCL